METKSYILKCPYCGTEKKVTFSAQLLPDTEYTYWSDGRVECDGWLETIRTHQCPSCGKFYAFSPATNLREVSDPCDDNGQLPYETLKQAITELSGDDYAESWARLEAWRAYNALYKKSDDIPAEEQSFNRDNMMWLKDYFSTNTPWFSLLVFELNRLLGNIEVCLQMLEKFTFEAFMAKTEARDSEKGIHRLHDLETMQSRYAKQMSELVYSLQLPLKPYDVNSIKKTSIIREHCVK